jgi:hypothetical protein
MFYTVDVLGLKVDVFVVDVLKVDVLEVVQMGRPAPNHMVYHIMMKDATVYLIHRSDLICKMLQ